MLVGVSSPTVAVWLMNSSATACRASRHRWGRGYFGDGGDVLLLHTGITTSWISLSELSRKPVLDVFWILVGLAARGVDILCSGECFSPVAGFFVYEFHLSRHHGSPPSLASARCAGNGINLG